MMHQFLITGDSGRWQRMAVGTALVAHYPDYVADCRTRTRISVTVDSTAEIHDFFFEYQELMDNSYRRIVDLTGPKPFVQLLRPQYEGRREDFVDVEWEFIIGHLSHPVLQEKIRRWAADPGRTLEIKVCHTGSEQSRSVAGKLRRRLPASVAVNVADPADDDRRKAEFSRMARYLHYSYLTLYSQGHAPTELPEDEVNRAWEAIDDDRLRQSSILNVMSIPAKMELLGHGRDDWGNLYALSADEVDMLTAVEHNRWCVERLIQGMRPCTDTERAEVAADIADRIAHPEMARTAPVSLKKKYRAERNAHFDLCAFSELGLDETGQSVVRYDRDLTAAIPLIVKTFHDRHSNG